MASKPGIRAATERRVMAKVINCECGVIIRGDTDDELVANAFAHIERDHPDLKGKRARDDILAAAEEV
jgi:predicted small metal-binding protein